VDKVAEAVEETGLGLAASTSKETLAALENAIRLLGIGLGSIGAISLGVASIGVINTMVMAIYERTREIGVMRACGATRVAIRRLFALEAALIGLMGGVIGLGISYLLAGFANYMFGIHSTTLGVSLTNVISFPIWLSAGVVAFTTVIGLLAGLYPAIRASRLNPVEALRYE
jgi:putative ABC transport system permease protein